MAQIHKHRCKTQVRHNTARSHCVPLETLFKGRADKTQPRIRARWKQQRAGSLFTRRAPRSGSEPGPLGPARTGAWPGPAPALRHPPGPGSGRAARRAAHAETSSPKWLPAPTKPARPPRSPSLAEFEFTGGGGPANPAALTPAAPTAAPLPSPPAHNKRRVSPRPSRSRNASPARSNTPGISDQIKPPHLPLYKRHLNA